MSNRVIAETIKLSVTINGKEHALELRNENVGKSRHYFMGLVDSLAETLAVQLQHTGAVSYDEPMLFDGASEDQS